MRCPTCDYEFDPTAGLQCPRCGETLECTAVACDECDACSGFLGGLRPDGGGERADDRSG